MKSKEETVKKLVPIAYKNLASGVMLTLMEVLSFQNFVCYTIRLRTFLLPNRDIAPEKISLVAKVGMGGKIKNEMVGSGTSEWQR